MKYASDISAEVLGILRSHAPLTSYLPGGAAAIYESYPDEDTDEEEYPVAVILSVISDNSTPDRTHQTKTWRIQITVKASRPWRESQSAGGKRAMQMVMKRVHEVLDRMDASHERSDGSAGGGMPNPMDDGYLAIANDWLITGHYSEDVRPSLQ